MTTRHFTFPMLVVAAFCAGGATGSSCAHSQPAECPACPICEPCKLLSLPCWSAVILPDGGTQAFPIPCEVRPTDAGNP